MFFIVTVKLDKQTETGEKTVSEQYLLEALNFSEAENNVIEQVAPYCSGEIAATNIRAAHYTEVFTSVDSRDDRWYEAKCQFVSFDEKTDKEKLTPYLYAVQAQNFEDAVKNFHQHLDDTMADFRLVALRETKLMDYFPVKLS